MKYLVYQITQLVLFVWGKMPSHCEGLSWGAASYPLAMSHHSVLIIAETEPAEPDGQTYTAGANVAAFLNKAKS